MEVQGRVGWGGGGGRQMLKGGGAGRRLQVLRSGKIGGSSRGGREGGRERKTGCRISLRNVKDGWRK